MGDLYDKRQKFHHNQIERHVLNSKMWTVYLFQGTLHIRIPIQLIFEKASGLSLKRVLVDRGRAEDRAKRHGAIL